MCGALPGSRELPGVAAAAPREAHGRRCPSVAPADQRPLRHDKIDKAGCVTLRVNGRLHHIGVGRTLTGTDVLLLVQDLHIRVIHATTGELLRDLILDPRKDYQPTGRPPGPTRKGQTPEPTSRGFGRPRCPETSQFATWRVSNLRPRQRSAGFPAQ